VRFTNRDKLLTFWYDAEGDPPMRPRCRTASLTGYADLARAVGLDPARLLADVGLHPAVLDAPDRWIPAVQAVRLLELSARRSGCPDFGLRLAQVRRLGTLGPISIVLRDEPDLRSALDLLVRYERAYNESLHLHLGEQDGVAALSVALELGEPVPVQQALDLVMGALQGIIRALVGDRWRLYSVAFAHAAPADPAPYHRMFGPAVRFGQASTELTFSAADLGAPVLISDASVRPYSRQLLGSVITSPEATTSGQLDEVVELLLPVGRCTLDQASRHLGIGPRDLQRRLAREGTTFSSVVQGTRERLAERYLSDDRRSLTDVAQLLGFSASSAFSRWFHEWSETTPSKWRRAARSDGPDPGAAENVRAG
jgi:AraC-like DNA-binding protein